MSGIIKHILGLAAILMLLACNVLAKGIEHFVCYTSGKFAHETDPTKYHECTLVGGKEGMKEYTHAEHSCPPDNCFISSSQACHFTDGKCGNSEEAVISAKTVIVCPGPGKWPHPDKKRTGSFIRCVEANDHLYVYEYQCPPTKPCYCDEKKKCVAECKE